MRTEANDEARMTNEESTPGSTPVSGVGEGVSRSQSLISEVRFGKMPKPTDGTSALPRPPISLILSFVTQASSLFRHSSLERQRLCFAINPHALSGN
jgi:hypothetical protein